MANQEVVLSNDGKSGSDESSGSGLTGGKSGGDKKTKPRPAGRGFMESCFHHSSTPLLSLHIGFG